MSLWKWIDIPPVWLAGFALCAWVGPKTGAILPMQQTIGTILIVVGLGLLGLAVFEMRRHRTTVIPHRNASSLVRRGVFRFSRNPIYLGDTLVLLGLILVWYTSLIFFYWSRFSYG
jgi:protein-S-isoprenylcysteine O-methyltransferase Ste14